ncbi:Mu transposase C-terminal domain-containing protein [Herbaspirillum sp. C9C3]|uniref:Mu transposase C-terminal domain-containing protein n=1 Tax=Herbaspirillum sp. C9C3 TaxID=2735271 RepID=UPI0015857446|nr:Mu transposase C-terminal domain-containing protein [Herbaspirillum sp. C9C3]NUT60154.1 transposase [Herbaspirillum sp. C9C3]
MKKFSISPGLLVLRKNVQYEMRRLVNGEKLIFESLVDGDVWNIEKSEFLRLWSEGEIQLVSAAVSRQEIKETEGLGLQDLDCFGSKQKEKALQRSEYIAEVQKIPGSSFESLTKAIEQVALRRKESPPSLRSVYRWIKEYKRNDCDVVSLVDRLANRGRPPTSGIVQTLLDESIKSVYLTLERRPATDVFDDLDSKISQRNKSPGNEPLVCPSIATIRRYIDTLNAYEVCVARYGKKEATRQFRSVRNTNSIKRILEEVQIDHGLANLFVIDDELMLPLGRPTITAARDTASRMPFGLFISFVPPSLYSVFSCLRDGILYKDKIINALPSIEGDWPVFGLPVSIKLDNGPEFHSAELLSVAQEFGISITWCPRHQPWFKGGIERYIKEQNAGLLEKLPGTTFSNLIARGDYDPEKHAVIRYSIFLELVYKWLIDVYMRTPSRDYTRPIDLWNDGIKETPVFLPESVAHLSVAFGRSETRTLRHDGIRLHNLIYNSAEMDELREKYGAVQTVTYKYQPADIGSIFVQHPNKKRYIEVPCIAPDYAKGLSKWQHDLIRKIAKERLKSRIDIDALRRAKAYLRELVAAEIKRKPSAARKAVAKMGEFGSDTALAGATPSVTQWLAPTTSLHAQVDQVIQQAKATSKMPAEIPKFGTVLSKKESL